MKRKSETGKLRPLSFIQKKEVLRRFARKAPVKESGIPIRALWATDREKIREILEDFKNLTREEIEIAISFIDEVLHGNSAYRFLVGTDEHDRVLGYICYGQTPMTSGTWDIYWIAVSRRFQRRRIGSRLLRAAEKAISTEGGRLIMIETSTKPSYQSTIKFYQKMGYHATAKIARFYSDLKIDIALSSLGFCPI